MAKRIKREKISSRFFQVIISDSGWFVRNRESGSSTALDASWEGYAQIKKVWRKSKTDFDSACRFMDFEDLFSVKK